MALIDAGSLIAGRYQLEARLDAGGQAQVWRASDQELGRQVAIKILLTPPDGDPAFLDAFKAEAQLEARMQHPGIVEVYDWGHDGDANYIVMELLDGGTVRQMLSTGPMLPDRVVSLGQQAAAALVFAHAQGVAHGSIGPDNVILSPEHQATIIGFGLQCRGACEYTALPDADTYAVGALMYEALLGASPTAPRPGNLPPREPWPASPHKMNPNVSPEFDRVVMKAVSPNVADRYRTAAELKAALDALTAPKRRTWLWALLAVLAVAAALAGVWLLTSAANVVVPDVTGLQSEQAQSALSDSGLTMVVTGRVPSPELPVGAVVAAAPEAGSKVRRGSQVGVTLSTGKPTATVPSVTGAGVEAASSTLTSAGLVVGEVTTEDSSAFPTDTVISQKPAAGEVVTAGTPVDLVVSAGRTQVTVPDVKGMTQASATSKLQKAAFVVEAGTTFSNQPSGVVVTQGPSAGSVVVRGSTVTISVSKGPAPVKVPDVIGAQAADAKKSLQDLGLVPVSVLTSGTAAQVGEVIRQTPVKGTEIPRGSQVEIIIGK